MGYDCPDGVDVAVDSCAGDADDAMCVLARVNHPLKDGAAVTFTETYGAVVRRIANCKMRPLMVLRGELEFAP